MINGIGPSSTTLLGGTPGGVQQSGAAGRTAAAQPHTPGVTTAAGRIAAEGAPVDGGRIAALRAAIRSGTYKPDAGAIATRMIAADLGSDG